MIRLIVLHIVVGADPSFAHICKLIEEYLYVQNMYTTAIKNEFIHELRLPYRNDAEIAKFCKLLMFWPVIQLINHLFKIRQKACLPNAMEHWAKKHFVRFQKDPLLAELQAKTSKGCRLLLFQHHSYMVTLKHQY